MPPGAVVDASVLVSAFLFPGSLPGRVLTLAGQDRFVLHLSPILLDETREALLSPRLMNAYVTHGSQPCRSSPEHARPRWEMVMLANHLLRIVDSRRKARG